ncbi:Larval cuticle protein LCP-22 [Eumeta japonica]|uniref:Larval cuticle protein LCP-22 n=1 Tax=Eumeta variegata TaxID=151549 RepID=A0A4C1YH47_EUMVA|nr:Larval cuticle protein LCP-22 [Eumeta japonica]
MHLVCVLRFYDHIRTAAASLTSEHALQVLLICATLVATNAQRFGSLPPFKSFAPVAARVPAPPPPPTVQRAVVRASTDDRSAQTLRFDNDADPSGAFSYNVETSNGIAAQAQGTPRNFGGNPPVVPVVISGAFRWVSPEGEPIDISYTADENGYQASGSAIPTPPPIPEAILRSLQRLQ